MPAEARSSVKNWAVQDIHARVEARLDACARVRGIVGAMRRAPMERACCREMPMTWRRKKAGARQIFVWGMEEMLPHMWRKPEPRKEMRRVVRTPLMVPLLM